MGRGTTRSGWGFAAAVAAGFTLAAGGWMAAAHPMLALTSPADPEIRWVAGLYAVKEEAVRRAERPALLLVGGSNVHFGLNARIIEERLGVRAVNFGTHAGLSLSYLLHRVEGVARPGDVVLLSLEYELLDYTGGPSEILTRFLYAHDPAYLARVPLWSRAAALIEPGKVEFMRALVPRGGDTPHAEGYRIETVTAWGDETANDSDRVAPEQRVKLQLLPPVEVDFTDDGTAAAVLDRFIAAVTAKGVRVIAKWPNIKRGAVALDDPEARESVAALTRFLEARGVPMLGDPMDWTFPPDEVFDTVYHPNTEGTRNRTEELIALLKDLRGLLPPARVASGS